MTEPRRRLRRRVGGLWLVSTTLLATAPACSGPSRPTRAEAAAAIATEVLQPLHQQAADALAALAEAIHHSCDEGRLPDEPTPAAVVEAFANARRAWSRATVVTIGPAKARRSTSRVDWRPADPARIAAELASPTPIDVERARGRLAANQRGLPAIAALLRSSEPELAAIDPARRCEYLIAITAVAAAEADAVATEWRGDAASPGYAARLGTDAAAGEATSLVDELVRGVVFALEDLVDRELRADAADGGPPIEVAHLLGRVEGIAALYLGALSRSGLDTVVPAAPRGPNPAGLGPLVAAIAPATDLRIRDQLARCLAAANDLGGAADTTIAVATPPLRDALVELQRTWSTEVVSALGVVIGFSDNDGDTG